LEEITLDRSYKSRFDDFGGWKKVRIKSNWGLIWYKTEVLYKTWRRKTDICLCWNTRVLISP